MPRLSKIGAAALAAFGWTSGTGVTTVTASYLTVAGGAGGGRGSGGGAGGMLTGTTVLTTTSSYTVIVGAGGNGATPGTGWADGTNGNNTTFTGLTAAVGGGTGGYGGGGGYNGGSGGGASNNATYPTYVGGLGTAGQGNNGGYSGFSIAGGGGGGAGAVGGNGTSLTSPGSGGNGLASSISGSSVTYAGGGGGSGYDTSPGAAGGSGGGGAGANAGTSVGGGNGTANLGGGGGGGHQTNNSTNGGNGGSGIVIISYAGAQQFGGGIVTSVGGNTIHTFLTSGTLSPLSSLSASYLIVAGGGGGGANNGGGGGGGGVLSGSNVTIDSSSTYIVTVGAGGTGATAQSGSGATGSNGANSTFSAIATTAIGGGGGGGPNLGAGQSGGSGGGGGNANTGSAAGGSGTSGQGNVGGTTSTSSASSPASGGGGAGQAGSGPSGNTGGAGGNGTTSSISGTATYYGGGGGGAVVSGYSGGAGGLGGGGAGAAGGVGTSGTANTGGGQGGSAQSNGGSGGSGIVIISYAGATQQMAGGSVTITGGNVIHTFTSSGYLTPLTYYSNSLRFRSSASAYLSRTPTVASNRKTWTWSGWVKRGQFVGGMYQGYVSTSSFTAFGWGGASAATLFMQDFINGSYNLVWETTALFRDPAAWYHVVWAYDSTQASSANALKLYVNGVQQSLTFNAYSGAYVQNRDTFINATNSQQIGTYSNNVFQDGYMSNINFIDGQALTANSFGTFNSYGVWQPINYGGSYGTNGFYLPFNSGSQTYAASFNGSTQYLTAPASANLQLGTSDYTIEMWVYSTSYGSPVLYDGKLVGGTAIQMYFPSGVANIYGGAGTGTLLITGSAALPTGQWNHVALTRQSNLTRLFINGIQSGSTVTDSTNYNDATSGATIGARFGGANFFSGNMSNFRLVKGTAVYTTNFTPSTSPLTAITGTQLLTLQNATIVDNSTNAFTITNTGSVTTATSKALSTAVFLDQSPQGNNWTPNNISGATGSTLDYMTDVPTLTSTTAANYCVVNPLARVYNANNQTADGNLKSYSTTADAIGYGTMAFPKSAGKWYAECTVNAISGTAYTNIRNIAALSPDQSYGSDGTITGTSSGATYTTGDVIGVAYDWTAQTVAWYKNGTLQGTTPSVSQTTDLTFANYIPNTSTSFYWNFGQQPWKYTPPSGYVALNTYNL